MCCVTPQIGFFQKKYQAYNDGIMIFEGEKSGWSFSFGVENTPFGGYCGFWGK